VSNPAQRLVGDLRRMIDARADRAATLRSATVEGRNTDGTLVLVRDDGECPIRGPKSGQEVGERVYLTSARGGRRGTSDSPARPTPGTSPIRGAPGLATLWVESLTPSRFERGSSVTVTVAGNGFSPTTEFSFLKPGESEDDNPDVTVAARRYVSPTVYEIDLVIAADARPIDGADLRYVDTGAYV